MHLERTKGGYRVRLVVPKRLREIVGQRELRYNIPSASRQEATVIIGRVVCRLKILFNELENGELMTNTLDIPTLVRQFINEGLAAVTDYHNTADRIDEGQFEDRELALRLLESDYQEAYAYHDRRLAVPIVNRLLESKGITVSKDSAAYQTLCMEIMRASVQLIDRELNTHKIEPLSVPQSHDREPRHTEAPSQPVPKQPAEHPLSTIIKEHWDENNEDWKRRTVTAYRQFREHLTAAYGTLPVESMGYEEARAHKAALLEQGLSHSRINMYLGYAGAVLKYACQHGYTTLNPFSGIQFKKNKNSKSTRDAFTIEDLNRIFGHPGYTEDSFKHAHQFWLPVLGVFTGARLEELCQLYVSQVQPVDGVWCFRFAEDHPEQSIKNGEPRVIPIHPTILDLGFLGYVQRLDPAGRLWPELKFIRDRYSHKVPDWFKKVRETVGIVAPPRKKTFHSFRHTVITRLNELDVQLQHIKEYVGHSATDITTGTYTKVTPPATMLELVAGRLDYPGLDLGHLKGSKWGAGKGNQ